MQKSDQGVTDDRFRVIPRTLIFITQADKVLLLKGAANKRLWANKYNGIGGHVEAGEDVYHSAVRELKEESGLDCDALDLCGSVIIDVGGKTGIHIFVFKGVYEQGDLTPSNEGTLEWVKIDQIDQVPLVEDLKIILPELFKLEKGKMLFARYHYNDGEHLGINYSIR